MYMYEVIARDLLYTNDGITVVIVIQTKSGRITLVGHEYMHRFGEIINMTVGDKLEEHEYLSLYRLISGEANCKVFKD